MLGWARVSNAVADPTTNTSLAQDQVVLVTDVDGEWFKVKTLEDVTSRVPKVLALPITNPLKNASERVVCAIAAFDAQQQGDLSFGIYSLLVVESEPSSGWYRGKAVTDSGTSLGETGTFPATFVKELSGFSAPQPVTAPTSLPTSFTTDFTQLRMRAPATQSSNVYAVTPYAKAKFAFNAEFGNELSFGADEIITLLRRIDADWLEGCVNDKTGIFPASFVDILVDIDETPSSTTSTSNSKKNKSSDEGLGFAVARHDFEGRERDELSVKMGDTVRVNRIVNKEWVHCMDPNSDKEGIVPMAFLDLYLEDDHMAQQTTRPSSMVDSSFASCTESVFNSGLPDWRTSTRIDEVSLDAFGAPPASSQPSRSLEWATFGEPAGAAKSAVPPARPPPPKDVGALTSAASVMPVTAFDSEGLSQQAKHAKVVEDLINTELQYITDINAYIEAVNANSKLDTKKKASLKSGCTQIVQLSTALVTALINEQGKDYSEQMIGACFLHLRKAFAHSYGYYFRNIEYINATIANSESPELTEALSELVVHMRNIGGANVFDAPSAMSRPVQRCLKYPLFISELIKLTPIQSADHPKLLEALKVLTILGQKMNESKRRKELISKYSEDAPKAGFGDMLSKLSLHSLKKKSNRFTYRMGSSIGVVKLSTDQQFDALVTDLDSLERCLVRFNYILIIYRKKMVFETKQIILRKIIEPRKKTIPSAMLEMQMLPYQTMVAEFTDELNTKVRDVISKSLRTIPKKLVKKRNDKLLDYEAAKGNAKVKADLATKFKDFEALNSQVKQALPKVIELLFQVLERAMQTVETMDSELCARMRSSWAQSTSEFFNTANHESLCICNFYDPDRLRALYGITNKAARKMRLTNVKRDTSFVPTDTTLTVIPSAPSASSSFGSTTILNSTVVTPSSNGDKRTFRAQTAKERMEILEKATLKNRRTDMFRCVLEWPASGDEPSAEGMRSLIVNKGDAVLAVRKDAHGSMWLCYNGVFNGLLPRTLLVPWFSDESAKVSQSLNAVTASSITARPHSTPPSKVVHNLIDLDDFMPASTAPTIAALTPLPVNAAAAPLSPRANVLPFVASPAPSSLSATETPIFGDTTLTWRDPAPPPPQPSLFDGMKPIDWGVPSAVPRTPSMPNLTASGANAFPVTFDEAPPFQPKPTPPLYPSAASSSAATTTALDSFDNLWQQISQAPLSSIVQRSDSPQPLIPTRPDVVTKPSAPNVSFSMPPQYDAVPITGSSAYAPTMYEFPPSEASYAPPPMSLGQYDAPPLELLSPSTLKPIIGQIQVNYAFSPVGPNQVTVQAGERVALLQAHDDEGNDEWLLVRKQSGESGYIPSAYCTRI